MSESWPMHVLGPSILQLRNHPIEMHPNLYQKNLSKNIHRGTIHINKKCKLPKCPSGVQKAVTVQAWTRGTGPGRGSREEVSEPSDYPG